MSINAKETNKFLWHVFGGTICIIPFLPLETIFGARRGIVGNLTPQEWILGCTGILLFSWLIAEFAPNAFFERLSQVIKRILKTTSPLLLPSLFLILALELLVVNRLVFQSQHRAL